MSTHAQLSPSKRHRWAVCPGSIREESKYPEQSSGPAAVDGTHSHTLLETCLKNNVWKAEDYVNTTLSDHEGSFVVLQDRAERVQTALDYIRSRLDQFDGKCEVIAERRVSLEWFTGRSDLSGTVDVQLRAPGVLEIIDYKDGMQDVPAENNLQLEQYAIGVLAECKLAWNVVSKYPWQSVRMTIIQPKLALRGKSPISTWVVTTGNLLDRLDTLSREARATDDPDAPLVSGDHCKFCRAKGACSALASDVMKEVGVMFQPVAQIPDLSIQTADKDPATMDDQQIRQILEAAPLMRQLLEAVEKEAQRRLEAGQVIPGLKLVNGRGSRSWSLPDDEIADKLLAMGVPKSALYETKLVSPAKVEKLTWEKRDGTKCALTDRQLRRLENEYVSRIAGKLTVVPESDSRPAVTMNAAPMFQPVEQPVESLPAWLV